LLDDLSAPLLAHALLSQRKAVGFVQVPGRIQSTEGPKVGGAEICIDEFDCTSVSTDLEAEARATFSAYSKTILLPARRCAKDLCRWQLTAIRD
jgi:hypothetical protein